MPRSVLAVRPRTTLSFSLHPLSKYICPAHLLSSAVPSTAHLDPGRKFSSIRLLPNPRTTSIIPNFNACHSTAPPTPQQLEHLTPHSPCAFILAMPKPYTPKRYGAAGKHIMYYSPCLRSFCKTNDGVLDPRSPPKSTHTPWVCTSPLPWRDWRNSRSKSQRPR